MRQPLPIALSAGLFTVLVGAPNISQGQREVFRCNPSDPLNAILEVTMLLTQKTEWKTPVGQNGQVVPLFHEAPKPDPFFTCTPGTELFWGLPGRWIISHELDYLDQQLPSRDPDGDLFTNIEEFRSETNPKDPASHPDGPETLDFMGRMQQNFQLVWHATSGGETFLIQRQEPLSCFRKPDPAETYSIGDTIKDSNLRLMGYRDQSLVVEHLVSERQYALELGKPRVIPTYFAELRPRGSDDSIYVHEGETIELGSSQYRLDSVEESGVKFSKALSEQTSR